MPDMKQIFVQGVSIHFREVQVCVHYFTTLIQPHRFGQNTNTVCLRSKFIKRPCLMNIYEVIRLGPKEFRIFFMFVFSVRMQNFVVHCISLRFMEIFFLWPRPFFFAALTEAWGSPSSKFFADPLSIYLTEEFSSGTM